MNIPQQQQQNQILQGNNNIPTNSFNTNAGNNLNVGHSSGSTISSRRPNTFEPTLLILNGAEIPHDSKKVKKINSESQIIKNDLVNIIGNNGCSGSASSGGGVNSGNNIGLGLQMGGNEIMTGGGCIGSGNGINLNNNDHCIEQLLSVPPFDSGQQTSQQYIKIWNSKEDLTQNLQNEMYKKIMKPAASIENLLKSHPPSYDNFANLPEKVPPQNMLSFNIQMIQQNKTMHKIDSTNSMQLQNIKGNVKNAYIKKISSLLNMSNSSLGDLANQNNDNRHIKIEDKESEDSEEGYSGSKSNDNNGAGNDGAENDDQKQSNPIESKRLKKNRESARNSRQRKKIYIDLLEKKVVELNDEIETVSEYLQKSEQYISEQLQFNPLVYENIIILFLKYFYKKIRGLVQDRHNYIQKIDNLQQCGNSIDEESLNLVLDSYRLRLGATGLNRVQGIEMLFKFMLKAFLENNYPYFLYGYKSPEEDGTIYQYHLKLILLETEDEEFNRCVDIFKDTIGLSDNDNQIYRVLQILRNLLEHRLSYKHIYKEVKQIKKEWRKRVQKIEALIDSLAPILTPQQLGSLIKKIEQNKNKSEIHIFKKRMQSDKGSLEDEVDKFNQMQYLGKKPVNFSLYYPILTQVPIFQPNLPFIMDQQQQQQQPQQTTFQQIVMETQQQQHQQQFQQQKQLQQQIQQQQQCNQQEKDPLIIRDQIIKKNCHKY